MSVQIWHINYFGKILYCNSNTYEIKAPRFIYIKYNVEIGVFVNP